MAVTKIETSKEVTPAVEEPVATPAVEEPVATPKVTLTEGGTDEIDLVPIKWKEAVNEILGPEFACTVVHMDSGGTKFKIIVPKEKTNVPQMYWEMFGQDIRTREIGNTGLTGVKEWCLKVRQNLLASGIKLIQYP